VSIHNSRGVYTYGGSPDMNELFSMSQTSSRQRGRPAGGERREYHETSRRLVSKDGITRATALRAGEVDFVNYVPKEMVERLSTPSGGQTIRSQLALTSAEVSSLPSWNVTPACSVKV